MRTTICAFVGILLSCACLNSLAADPLDSWTVRSPTPTPNDLRAVTTGNGLVIAVGTASTILTSPDAGDTWTAQNPGVTNNSVDLVGVAYGGGRFVALPESGSQGILTSVDGTNWVASTNVFIDPTHFTGITYGGGTFVAVGYGSPAGTVTATSSGSRLPQTQVINTPTNQGLLLINYDFYGLADQMTVFYNGTNIFDSGYVSGNGQFGVNFGPGPSNSVSITMNQFTNPNPLTQWDYSVVISSLGGGTSSNVIMTSADGLTWTRQAGGITDALNAVTYAQGQFVAVGGTASPTNRGYLMTSPNGVNWTLRRTNVPALYAAVAGNSNGFVAVGGRLASRSINGTTWLDFTDGTGAGRKAVAASSNLFVSTDSTLGVNDSSRFYTSTNGAAWTTNGLTESISALTFANGRFHAVGSGNSPGLSPLGTKPALYFSDDGVTWNRRVGGLRNLGGSRPPEFAATVYGNGAFVAFTTNPVGQAPVYFISTNGADWSGNIYGSGLPGPVAAAIFTNGLFVTVGGNGGNDSTLIATATIVTNWTVRFNATIGTLSSVAFGNSLYVAVGRRSSGERPILTSPDALGWTLQTPGITNDLFGVAFGSGNFVSVGTAGTVARSADGVSWATQSITASNHLRGVTFASSQFVAVGDGGSIFTSPTGVSWTRRTSGTTRDLNTITYFNGRYVVGGDGGKVITSTDAINWSATDSGTDLAIYATAAGANRLLLVGESILLDTSTNGLDWTLRDASYPVDALFRDVLGVDDRVFALGGGHAVSPTGRSWAGIQTGGLIAGNSAVYTNGLLVAAGTEELGQASKISVSTDRGDSWTTTNLGNFGQLYGIIHGNGMFVAVGNLGAILTSTNGYTWTLRNSGTNASLYDITYGNGLFVASGDSGAVKSTDGITWTPNPGAVGGTVTYGNGKFIVGGNGLLLSTNGSTWVRVLTNTVTIETVRFGLGTFVAVGQGIIYTSTDGTNWQNRFVRTRQKLNGVNFVNDSCFIAGFSGTIFQSGFITNTPATIVRPPQNTTVIAGQNAQLSVNVTGRLPMSFQWYKNGVPIAGATDINLRFNSATPADGGSYYVIASNDFGSQQSASATLTVLTVTVTVNPEILYLFTGTTGAFTAAITGATPTGYQWDNNGTPRPGATNATLTFTNAQTSNSLGYYFVTAFFPYGQVRSAGAGLAVLSSLDEVILSIDPGYQAIPIGDTGSITSLVYGPTPQSYQWRKDNVPLAGATNAVLTFTNAQLTNSADYTFTVTYSLGTVTNLSPSTLLVYYAEAPVIKGVSRNQLDQVQITFTGLTNRYYQIDYATNLASPTDWMYYDSPQLLANPFVYPIDAPALGMTNRGFFRVKILPP